MVTGLVALLALVSGCEAPRSPVYGLEFAGCADPDTIWAGAAAWRELDYGLAPLDGAAELWVTVECVDLGGELGGLANAELGLVLLDEPRLSRQGLQRIAAHEFGHVFLPTSEHTARGVMASPPTSLTLLAEDRALACRAAGRGCE